MSAADLLERKSYEYELRASATAFTVDSFPTRL